MFIDDSLVGENLLVPTSVEFIPREGPIHSYVDHDSQLEFIESFNIATLSDATVVVDELKQIRNKKLKKSVEIEPTRLKAP